MKNKKWFAIYKRIASRSSRMALGRLALSLVTLKVDIAN